MLPDGSNIESLPTSPKGAGERASRASARNLRFDTIPVGISSAPSTEDFSVDFPTPQATEDESGLPHRLGRYELLEKIGGGGMGIVFRALDTELQRTVALKTIREGVFAESQEVERFINEAQAIAKLNHPNIVAILDIGRDQGHHYFTMQLATGGALSNRLEEYCKADPRQSVLLMEKIIRAVHCAHQHLILHRDLKPANILLNDKGEPLVSDFGLVKFLDRDKEITQAGKAMGTRPYMSPEQLGGLREEITPATDIWALGVVLYELLTQQRPFASASEDELTKQIQSVDPPSPRKLRPQLDRDLETIVLKCLRKNPIERYASAQDLADDIRLWLERKPIQAKPVAWRQRLRKHLGKRALLALVGLAILFAIAAAFLSLGKPDPDRWVAEIPKQLKGGKAVTLIGPTGGFRWASWASGPAKELPAFDAKAPFRLESSDIGLLELIPNPGVDSYRFRGEVRHVAGDTPYEVGMYFARGSQPTESGWVNLFLTLSFTDVENVQRDPVKRNPMYISAYMRREPDHSKLARIYSGSPTYYEPHLGLENPGRLENPWRTIAIEVYPDRFRAYWQNKLVEGIGWKAINATSAKNLSNRIQLPGGVNELKVIDPDFGPQQGLGLFVTGSAAEFRNVVIEPIIPAKGKTP
ncbi:MAG: serine/threonine protein kinase [Planctomycetes bacterium]|nr:serine/threonine protein kinase [Planctomycetota bacterium]